MSFKIVGFDDDAEFSDSDDEDFRNHLIDMRKKGPILPIICDLFQYVCIIGGLIGITLNAMKNGRWKAISTL